jgi:ATP-binding cassette subfamily F protein 3
MITLRDIVLQRGTQRLLEGASLTIHPGRRIGIIGANGSGKSSLFALLMGQLQLDAGELNIPAAWRMSHMAQEVATSQRSALDYVVDGDMQLRKVEAGIAQLTDTAQHNRLAALYAELEVLDGYNANNRAEQLLHGLGFTSEQVGKPVSSFSGGWRIRLNLAQALMCPSDLLLLDEPTNHLDLDATLWLEQWLKAYPGTLLLISHDRDFLDTIADEIVCVEQQQLQSYRGNYSAYETQKAQRLAQQQAGYEKQQRRVAEIQQFVNRFRAKATKAKQAQSRLKELERMELIAPAHIDSPFKFVFWEAEKNSTPLINLSEATLGYGDTEILQQVEFSLQPGSRIGLLGPNGAGKSTLVKSLVGDLELLAGHRVCGEHLAVGYFAQHQLEALDLDASAALHIQRLSPAASEQEIRNFLGGFNFHGDKTLEPIAPFSGGEKARLALAIIVWQKPNLLLLDEPTNHLDLEMRHALEMALQGYAGALVVISHDRHLLRNTVDEFYLVANGGVESFGGTLADYQAWLKTEALPAAGSVAKADDDKQDKKMQRQQAAQQRQQLAPLRNKVKAVEREMEKLQQQLDTIEQRLAGSDIYLQENKADLQNTLQQRGALQAQLEHCETQWLQVQEQLESMAV